VATPSPLTLLRDRLRPGPTAAALLALPRTLWAAGLRRMVTLRATATRSWRRSLQLRIVTITLVLSSVLVGAFGWVVVGTITSGLFASKQRAAHSQLSFGANYALSQLNTITERDDPGLPSTVIDVVGYLAQTTGKSGGVEVALVPPSSLSLPARSLPDSAASRVPRALRDVVAGDGKVAHQLISVRSPSGGMHQYYVYGSPLPTTIGDFQLYYLFPLEDEVSAASLVRTTVIGTGVALVVLLALVSALVTRLVVQPVRMAARTAQRLSAGLLDQRMEVRGEDDLARLAASFNQMAANLQRQILRLEEMSRQQRRFTSDVSHELRTPLTTVRMAADLIHSSRDEFDPAVARSAELLHAELDRFEDLLTDLLEISRYDAGFAVLDAEPTDLVPVVRRVVDQLTPVARQAGVEVRLDVPDEPVIAELDPRRVERVLRNLVGNAIEHGEARPVQVTARADDGAAAVTVRDHGIGLGAGEDKLVFNRFWRADPSRARQTGGTGLGLSISLEDARLHGGWLEAWGARGQGAQFRLTLPLRVGDRLVASPLRLVPDDARIDPPLPLPLSPAGRPALAASRPAPGVDDD
jgi:two-component system sensor histidine kinase MtrB